MTNPEVLHPRAFISYCWTSPDHEQWVMDLATRLVEHGVDVILDKWNLREGHDAVAFMESSVNDPSINKVIIVSDKKYSEKANSRKGGVGTESQIISPEVYKRTDQSKFTAVVPEVDENGEPYLPTFLGTRIFINMTPALYGTNFEQLLRWLYDKPQFVKPALGSMPEFLNHTPSQTRATVRRSIDRIRTSGPNSSALTNDYLDSLVSVLEEQRLEPGTPQEFPQAVLDNIESFLPYRNEFIEFMLAAAPVSNADLIRDLQRLFERIIPLMFNSGRVSSYRSWDFDNYAFVVHELFLYAIAALLKHERFQSTDELLAGRFYVPDETGNEPMKPFWIIRKHMQSLMGLQQDRRRLSLRADLLQQRSHVVGRLKFDDIMQADLVLFLRAISQDGRWYPETLLYACNRYSGPFEIFARSESKAYFSRVAPVIGVTGQGGGLSALEFPMLVAQAESEKSLPHWQFESPNISYLTNKDRVSTLR